MNSLRMRSKKLLCFVLILCLLVPQTVFAAGAADAAAESVTTGSFIFDHKTRYGEQPYLYSDSWFFESAFEENVHLRTMSLVAAMTSSATYCSYAYRSQDEEELLEDLGFSHIETNAYFSETPVAMSAGCCMGEKQITDADGTTYTLLVLLPRSFGYDYEWIGNFIIGNGDYHEGFAAGRDEVLSFARSYVETLLQNASVSKNLKIWLAGHSRGAAIANLAAGYLVDHPEWLGADQNGTAYLTAENIYAYTFSTPKSVDAGLNPKNERYSGIHNYCSQNDPISMLMPAWWNFAAYGQDAFYTDLLPELTTREAHDLVETFIEAYFPTYRDDETLGQDPACFTPYNIGITTDGSFGLVPDTSLEEGLTQREFLLQRLQMMTDAFCSKSVYVSEGYQDVVAAFLRLIIEVELLPLGKIQDYALDFVKSHLPETASAVLWMFLAYSVETNPYNFMPLGLINYTLQNTLSWIESTASDLLRSFDLSQQDIDEAMDAVRTVTDQMAAICKEACRDEKQAVAAAQTRMGESLAAFSAAFLNELPARVQQSCALLTDPEAAGRLAHALASILFGVVNCPSTSIGLLLELKPILDLAGNFGSLVSEHTQEYGLSYLRAADPYYALPGDADGPFNWDAIEADFADPSSDPSPELPGEHDEQLLNTEHDEQLLNAEPRELVLDSTSGASTELPGEHDEQLLNTEHDEQLLNAEPKERILTGTGTPALLIASAPASFTDVPQDAWYADAVAWAFAQHITDGMAETAFDPEGLCTRSQVVTFLWRMAGEPAPAQASAFTDVPQDAWYADAVAWAFEQHITDGMTETAFDPDGLCTRSQVVTFLWRMAGEPAPAQASPFIDVPQDAWYAEAVFWAFSQGIVEGMDEFTFDPVSPCTRAQMVALLQRFAAQSE